MQTDACPACLPAADPMHLPHLIGPMKHYLWILKTTHGGADMDTCLEMAKGGLDGKPTAVTDHVHVCSYAVPKTFPQCRHASLLSPDISEFRFAV